ncbi:MAG: 30S ribosomal protein S20 [Bacteroidales bacterium]|jgi:small subunit ribosomal protein S20|nr:30S ribosomal protein S20 [Bacteroidales bacterium]
MANHKSSLKRIRANETRRIRNRYYGKTMRNAVRKFRSLENKAEAAEKLPKLISMIDKLAKKTIIHKNKAGNLKSKLTRLVNKMA